MDTASQDGRVIRLEENAYFLEEKINSLDTQISAQQKQLDELGKKLEQIRLIVLNMRERLAESAGDGKIGDGEIPPHHAAKFW